ncbi:hypothetical protein H4582DRAFT_2175233 [Lactarius indigo]|nr:hypothetical protein H4582DRAFT_2175233 [Lactarius indigo]
MDLHTDLASASISHAPQQSEVEIVRDLRHIIETVTEEAEEAMARNDCSHCLTIVKDLRLRLIAECSDLADDVFSITAPNSEDGYKRDALEKKLLREEERRMAALSDVEEIRSQLETCKRDLNEAERQRAVAMVYRTEVETLRKKLSEKEGKVQDIHTELTQRERELVRLKDKRSARGKSPPKIRTSPGVVGITSLSGQPFSQTVPQGSHSRELTQEHCLLAHSGAEEVYNLELERLHFEVQSLEKALDESNRIRLQVETELENEISQRESSHLDIDAVGRLSNDVLVRGHGAADTTSGLNQEADQELDGDISGGDIPDLAPPSRSFSPAPRSDISWQYSRLHQKLLLILSIFIAFIAIVIQHELESEKQRRNTGLIRPGWARLRSDVYQHTVQLAKSRCDATFVGLSPHQPSRLHLLHLPSLPKQRPPKHAELTHHRHSPSPTGSREIHAGATRQADKLHRNPRRALALRRLRT